MNAVLRRERIHFGQTVEFCVKGAYIVASAGADVEIQMGPIVGAWWDVPLPACPDCGGEVVWFEAGYVPGTRLCAGCGSLFAVKTIQQPVAPPAAMETCQCANGHRWQTADTERDWRCPQCGKSWV